MTRYQIWSPPPTNVHGGVRALHALRDELQARGVDAWMHYERPDADALTVYPEILTGNPLGAHSYVRWLLNRAPHPIDECWAWETGMGTDRLLTVNIIELDLWQPRPGPRSGVAYWIGKGHPDPAVIPDTAEHIGRHNYPTRLELAARIASLDYLISFDPFTAVVLEAVLVGTPVLIHAPRNQWTRTQVEAHGWTPHGIAWTPDELDHARATVHHAHPHYERLLATFQGRIDAFLQATHTD